MPPARGLVQTRTPAPSEGEPGSVRQKPQHHRRPGDSLVGPRTRKQGKNVRTYSPKPADIQREWHVIDATDVRLGRLAVQVATLLRGKHKPTYAPHMDGGDFVIVVNASKVSLSGDKLTSKLAYRHSGYPG